MSDQQPKNPKQMAQHGKTDANTSGNERVESDSDRGSALTGDALELSYPTSEEPVVEYDRIDIPRGEIMALVGSNGSGKSTLLESLAKQLSPDSGSVHLDGESISEYDDKAFTRELGMLSQQYDSSTPLIVEDLVYHNRYPHRSFFEQVSDDDREAVERAIDPADVEHIRDEQIGNLSGGQGQFVWIAMMLAQDTDILLFDEPTAYLDLHHRLRVLETARQLNEEHDVTVVVVLHDITQAMRFVGYLVAMQDGKLYDWGPSREVVTEEPLADVFRVEAAVDYSPDPEIIPKRSL